MSKTIKAALAVAALAIALAAPAGASTNVISQTVSIWNGEDFDVYEIGNTNGPFLISIGTFTNMFPTWYTNVVINFTNTPFSENKIKYFTSPEEDYPREPNANIFNLPFNPAIDMGDPRTELPGGTGNEIQFPQFAAVTDYGVTFLYGAIWDSAAEAYVYTPVAEAWESLTTPDDQ